MHKSARLILTLLAIMASFVMASRPAGAASALGFNVNCTGFQGNGATTTEAVTWKVRVARWADGNYSNSPTVDVWYEGSVAAGNAFSPSATWASRNVPIISGTESTASYYWWWIYNSAGQVIATGENHFNCTTPPTILIDCYGFKGNGMVVTEQVTWKVELSRWPDGNYANPPAENKWYEGTVEAGSVFAPSGLWAFPIVSGEAANASYYRWWIYNAAGEVIAASEGHFNCTTPPPACHGCTPGYWKQNQHFDSWVGYSPNGSFSTAVGRNITGNPTMLQALGANGGGLRALMRHTAAALLNSTSSIGYQYTTAQVVSMFQAAYDSGNYEATKNLFAAANEAGCPLN